MPKKPLSINFAKQREPLSDQVLAWALKIGTVLIIIVEIIGFTAFLYRFILDIQVGNLKADIKQKQTVIYNFQTDETKYRNLQQRLTLASSLSKENTKLFTIFTDILNLVPSGLTVNNISLDNSAISMAININSIPALSSFINSLKNYPNIQSISIDKIESKTASSTLTTNITINLKGT